ncbi:MAG: histidinol-phosphate transaminase [Thiomicrospira sp.]
MRTTEQAVAQWVRPEIRQIQAYHVQDAQGMIKLDAMENPYAWTPEMQGGWIERMRTLSFNRYPDPSAQALREKLRDNLGLDSSQSLVFGNGSDELIQLLMLALATPQRVVMAPTPTFVMYEMIARFVGMQFVGVPLQDDFCLDEVAMLAAIAQHQPALIFLAYPNNPTGNAFRRDQIERIIQASAGLVVVDEAYHAFAEDSFMADIARYPNLVVMRTFSKQGLAGFRLGYMVGNKAWMNEFDKVRLPYNINVLTQAGVLYALEHEAVLLAQAELVKQERAALIAQLQALPIQVYPTQANFITLRVPTGQADRIFQGLKADNILIKNLSPNGGRLADCLRVTVGTPSENQAFLQCFSQHLLATE